MYVLSTDRNSRINSLHIGTYDKCLNISRKAILICQIADLTNSMVILEFFVLFKKMKTSKAPENFKVKSSTYLALKEIVLNFDQNENKKN